MNSSGSPAKFAPIHQAPHDERPRERCLRSGAASLSLRECLAVIFGSGPKGQGCLGLAKAIIETCGHGGNDEAEEQAFFRLVDHAAAWQHVTAKGLGPAARSRLLVLAEMARRYAAYRQTTTDAANIKPATSIDALNQRALQRVPSHRRCQATEWLGFVPLYEAGRIGAFYTLTEGSLNQAAIDPTECFARILSLRPQGFWLYHNHPSGALRASASDRSMTAEIARRAQAIGLRFLGHWLVTAKGSCRVGEER